MERGTQRETTEADPNGTLETPRHELSGEVSRIKSAYTNLFCQRVPPYALACFIYGMLFLVIGLINGYERAVHIVYQSQKASLSELSNFSFGKYPFILKVFLGPVIDRFYIKTFGKSKTYLISSGCLLAIGLCLAGLIMDDIVKNNQIWLTVAIIIALNVLLMIFQVASTTWLLTLFQRE